MVTLCDVVTYVLLCEKDIYYVGKSTQLKHRLQQHFNGNGSVVTRIHKPLTVVAIFSGDKEKQAVLHGRSKYGSSKCFGYNYHLHSK
jgi:predicted GIY-YIG superfamily endonuclease